MNWFYKQDKTAAILTAEGHIRSMHIEKKELAAFPKNAILFYMHGGEEYLCQNYGGKLMMELGIGESPYLSSLLADLGYQDIRIRKDYAGINRMILAVNP